MQEEDFDVHLHSKRASPQLLEDAPLEPVVSPADNGLRQRRKGSEFDDEWAGPASDDPKEPDPVNSDPTKPEASENVDEEEEWSQLQKNMKNKSPSLDTVSGESHSVHCPYFPLVSDSFSAAEMFPTLWMCSVVCVVP